LKTTPPLPAPPEDAVPYRFPALSRNTPLASVRAASERAATGAARVLLEPGPGLLSAQLLYNGNYFFLPALVALTANHIVSFNMQLMPNAGAISGTTVLNVEGTEVYRSWQMPNMYAPPIS
jgi:predicted transporter